MLPLDPPYQINKFAEGSVWWMSVHILLVDVCVSFDVVNMTVVIGSRKPSTCSRWWACDESGSKTGEREREREI